MASKCVVIAETNCELLTGIRDLIHDMFDSVVMVGDEKSMSDVVERVKPELLIVDLSLPVCKEVNVARSIHRQFPELDFIVVSIHDEEEAVTETLESGAAGFVLKRCVATDLIPGITSVLSGHRYVSPDADIPERNTYQTRTELEPPPQ